MCVDSFLSKKNKKTKSKGNSETLNNNFNKMMMMGICQGEDGSF